MLPQRQERGAVPRYQGPQDRLETLLSETWQCSLQSPHTEPMTGWLFVDFLVMPLAMVVFSTIVRAPALLSQLIGVWTIHLELGEADVTISCRVRHSTTSLRCLLWPNSKSWSSTCRSACASSFCVFCVRKVAHYAFAIASRDTCTPASWTLMLEDRKHRKARLLHNYIPWCDGRL